MEAVTKIYHNGFCIDYAFGSYIIEGLPTLPFLSLQHAKNYIDDKINQQPAYSHQYNGKQTKY